MADFQDTTEQEIWKEIPGHPGYEASTFGNIRSHRFLKITGEERFKVLKKIFIRRGRYVAIGRYINKKVRLIPIHQLILLTFIGPCPPGMQSCHNDGDAFNNRPENLRWDTPKNNQKDRIKHGTHNLGMRNPNRKLTDAQVYEIRRLRKYGMCQHEIAKLFHVSQAIINDIVNRHIWKHIP